MVKASNTGSTLGQCIGNQIDKRVDDPCLFMDEVQREADVFEQSILASFEDFMRFNTEYELLLDETLLHALYKHLTSPHYEYSLGLHDALRGFIEDEIEKELLE